MTIQKQTCCKDRFLWINILQSLVKANITKYIQFGIHENFNII